MKELSSPWQNVAPGFYTAGFLDHDLPTSLDSIKQWLLAQRVHFGLVWEAEDFIFAATDRVRSFPLFFTIDTSGNICLADHADKLRMFLKEETSDDVAIAIYLESGYCVGDQTFIKEIRQLRPGEMLIWSKSDISLQIIPYYHYIPRFSALEKDKNYQRQLGDILDVVIERVITQAAGREIWVPLSGGLDSRLIICKLHEHGYKNIKSFSWGPPGNTEAKTAEIVAKALEIPWRLIPPNFKREREIYNSQDFSIFLNQVGMKCFAPTLNDYFTLYDLHEQGEVGPHTIIVNGQSGDYITGGHFPILSTEGQEEQIQSAFIKKHFGLWKSLQPDVQNIIREFILRSRQEFVALSDKVERDIPLSFYGWLEWRERQSKYVVACQQTYNYFQTDWALPLWDADLMDFYENVPLEFQIDQRLYIDYLQTWNYKGLFSFIREPVNPWPRNRLFIVSVARMVGIIFGQKRKSLVYRFMAYWGSHGNYYQLLPMRIWKFIFNDIQNHESVYAVLHLLKSDVKKDGLRKTYPSINHLLSLFRA